MKLRTSTIVSLLLIIFVAGSIPSTRASTVSLHFATNVTTAGTSITFNGVTYHNGDSGTFDTSTTYPATANPDVGYAFTGWSFTGGNSTCITIGNSNSPTTTVKVSCDGLTLIADFAPTYQVTFSTDPSSTVFITWIQTNQPSVNYTNGQSGNYPAGYYGIQANPGTSGDTFSYWNATGGVSVPPYSQPAYPDPCNNPGVAKVAGAGGLEAVFNGASPPSYSVTFSYNMTRGEVTVDGLPVSDTQVASYVRGCHRIQARASPGYSFTSFSVTGGAILAVSQPAGYNNTLVVTGTGTLTANFGTSLVNFLSNPLGGGTITFNGKSYGDGQMDSFEPGTSFTATATPTNSSYTFKGWTSFNGVTLNSASSNPTTGKVSSSGTIIANYALQTSCGTNCNIQVNSTEAQISNIQYIASASRLSFNVTGPTGGHADVSVTIPVSTGININQLKILVNNTSPSLPYTYTCDSSRVASPCTATSFYTVTFTVHFSTEYIFFYLGSSVATPPYLAIVAILIMIPLLVLARRRTPSKHLRT